MNQVYLGIGGNLGDKHNNFTRVYQDISTKIGQIKKKSSVYETSSWGFQSQDPFWNSVIMVETKMQPDEILWRIHEIEDNLGRERKEEQFSSRTMDIDILYFNDEFMETKSLIIPHPRMCLRKFVLVPLAEIAPALKHPLRRLTSLKLLEACLDESVIKKLDVNME